MLPRPDAPGSRWAYTKAVKGASTLPIPMAHPEEPKKQRLLGQLERSELFRAPRTVGPDPECVQKPRLWNH